MSDFIKELNSISRSKQEVEAALQKNHAEKIHNSMHLEKELLKDFDENFISNIKFAIKKSAFAGNYTELENGMKRIEGEFSLVKKFIKEYVGINYFNGIKFNNEKIKMETPFEANLIVYEPAVIKKPYLPKRNGYRIYANTIITTHIIEILEKENIKIFRIENLPGDAEFVSARDFDRNYINRTITFYYRIDY